MARARREREFHTRLGWWVMTQPRGGAVVIGSVASLAFVADLGYVTYRRHGFDTPFHRGFAAGILGMWLLSLIVDRLGVAEPLGSDRALARRRARSISRVHALSLPVVVTTGLVFGPQVVVGLLLGCVIYVFGLFMMSSAREIAHPHVAA